MPKITAVIDPAIKRGAGLRPEDRRQLIHSIDSHMLSALEHVATARRMPAQVFDLGSSDPLIDSCVKALLQLDQAYSQIQLQLKLLKPLVSQVRRSLEKELTTNPMDDV